MNVFIYFAVLAMVAGFALVKGGQEERRAALVCITASLASRLIFAADSVSYADFQPWVAVVDLAVLAAFVAIALRTSRFWPLWVAGLQLTATIGHMLKVVDPSLMPIAYAAALASWSYPILLIIAVGTWRFHRRVMSASPPAAT